MRLLRVKRPLLFSEVFLKVFIPVPLALYIVLFRSGNLDSTAIEMQKKYEEQLAASKKVSINLYA